MATVSQTRPRAPRRASRPAPKRVPHPTPAERAAKGKAARAAAPRSAHGEWAPARDRRDPVELLEEQAASRVPELVPIRYGRMLVSPFTFYRGAAYPMAADLADEPRTGLDVQLCGDAHLSNFGAFAAADRRLVFSINDFDETLPGPFEWDVKRLVASFDVAGRDRGFDAKQRRSVNLEVTRSYREAIRNFAGMTNLELWYSRIDVEAITSLLGPRASRKQRQLFKRNVAKAHSKDSMRASRSSRRWSAASAGSSATRRSSSRSRRWPRVPRSMRSRSSCASPSARVPEDADARPASAARAVPVRPRGAQGRRRRQRRHARLDRAHARPRRRRSPVPAAQGGRGIGARAVPGQEHVRPTTASGSSKGSASPRPPATSCSAGSAPRTRAG